MILLAKSGTVRCRRTCGISLTTAFIIAACRYDALALARTILQGGAKLRVSGWPRGLLAWLWFPQGRLPASKRAPEAYAH
jgi:hypothetical protein